MMSGLTRAPARRGHGLHQEFITTTPVRRARRAPAQLVSASRKADFFAMCANERGRQVRAFDSFEDAIDWFSATHLPHEG
jgi:hypothetical protein